MFNKKKILKQTNGGYNKNYDLTTDFEINYVIPKKKFRLYFLLYFLTIH